MINSTGPSPEGIVGQEESEGELVFGIQLESGKQNKELEVATNRRRLPLPVGEARGVSKGTLR